MTDPVGLAHEVDQYVDRCAMAKTQAQRALRPWEHLETEFRILDDFSIETSRKLGFRPAWISSPQNPSGQVQLIPYPAHAGSGPANVQVASLGGSRTTEPVSMHALTSLSSREGMDFESVEDFHCIAMSQEECSTAAVVSVTKIDQGTSGVNEVSWRRFFPLSEVASTLPDVDIPARLAIRLPTYASVDVVAVRVEVEITLEVEDLNATISMLKEELPPTLPASHAKRPRRPSSQAAPDQEHAKAAAALMNLGYVAADVLEGFQDCLRIVTDSHPDGRDPDRHPNHHELEQWAGGIQAAADAFRKWHISGRGSLDAAIDSHEQFKELIVQHRVSEFIVPMRVDESGSIDLAALRKVDSRQRLRLRVAQVIVPFTTEREPSGQGKMSAMILFLLASLMLLVSWIGWFWAPTEWGNIRFASGAPPVMSELRDPIVAVLLLFPAGLYGLFFQHRPKSPAGVKAQLSTFALLSVLFVIPVFPAALIAIGAPTEWATAVLTAGALLALAGSVATLLVLSSKSLMWMRVAAIRGVRPDTMHER